MLRNPILSLSALFVYLSLTTVSICIANDDEWERKADMHVQGQFIADCEVDQAKLCLMETSASKRLLPLSEISALMMSAPEKSRAANSAMLNNSSLKGSSNHCYLTFSNDAFYSASISDYARNSVLMISNQSTDEVIIAPHFSYKKPVTVAIFPFSNDTGDKKLDWLSNGVPDKLISKLIKSKRVRMIDNESIKEIINQIGMGASDLFDPANVMKIGKLAAAKLIIRGSYQKRSDGNLEIIVKFTDVETGTIIEVMEQCDDQKNVDNLIEQVGNKLILVIDPSIYPKIPNMQVRSRNLHIKPALLSLCMPGLGQYMGRRYTSGTIFLLTGLSSIAGTAIFYHQYEKSVDRYNDAVAKYRNATYATVDLDEQEMIKAYDDADRKFLLRQLAFATTGGIWAINVLHAMISGSRDEYSSEMPHTELANWSIRAQLTQYSASILAFHRF